MKPALNLGKRRAATLHGLLKRSRRASGCPRQDRGQQLRRNVSVIDRVEAEQLQRQLGEGFQGRDMLTEAQKSAALEIRHRHCKIQSRVNKFAQNLHVLKMAVEAEKEGLDPCSKQVCFFVLHRPLGKVR